MPENEKVELIIEKLKPCYQEKLWIDRPTTLSSLNAACLNIEAGLTAMKLAENRTNRQANRPNFQSNSKPIQRKETDKAAPQSKRRRRPRNNKNNEDKPSCSRCGYQNHSAKECYAKKHRDGSEISSKPAAERPKKINLVESKTSNQTPVSSNEPDKPPVSTVRSICATFEYTGEQPMPRTPEALRNMCVDTGNHLKTLVTVNGTRLEAMVDTGASVSLLDANLARSNNWPIEDGAPMILDAEGRVMNATGLVKVTIELRLNNVVRKLDSHVVAVENLCVPLLMGMRLLSWLSVVIDTSNNHLSFSQKPSTGVRLDSNVILPPTDGEYCDRKSRCHRFCYGAPV